MNTPQSFFWHDYETFGANPKYDRPSQFAGVRTDIHLNEIDEPIDIYCQITPDYWPHPEACFITGISPQDTLKKGLPEFEFTQMIYRELSKPSTCGVGYNNIRFDDELTRHLFFRNLFDPYGREWQNNCSRFDLLDVMRMVRVLRPDGLNWPTREDGSPSFKLEHLAKANHILHDQAHTALSDVRALLALARLVKKHQPKLWDYALSLRDQHVARDMLNLKNPQIILHFSDMYKAEFGAMTLALPLGVHPGRPKEIILWDLRFDPHPFFELDIEQIRHQLFTKTEELSEEGLERIPLKTLHINRVPMIVNDLRFVTPQIESDWKISLTKSQEYAQFLNEHPEFLARLREAFYFDFPPQIQDIDVSLYGGDFLKDQDKTVLFRLMQVSPAEWNTEKLQFIDPRLNEIVFRCKARSWPSLLTPTEQIRFANLCSERANTTTVKNALTQKSFAEALENLSDEQKLSPLFRALEEYGRSILR
jgi:exodeoxyribonuclease-1